MTFSTLLARFSDKLNVRNCALCLLLAAGCAQPSPVPHDVTVASAPAQPPEGVVRYCWEEPMAQLEKNGPGLDSEGRWYHPSYVAVREVRSGRWRPCRPLEDEIVGNE